MCCDFFPHLALQNCTCKAVHLCHSCSHLDCTLPWYLQAMTVPCISLAIYMLSYPITNQALCCLYEYAGFLNMSPRTTENSIENVLTCVPLSEAHEKKRWGCISTHITLACRQHQRVETVFGGNSGKPDYIHH